MSDGTQLTAAGWIDVSVTLQSGMPHWPSNPPVEITLQQSIERGDHANVSALSLGAHSGTHMDAPRHFIRDGFGIDRLPLDAVLGRARLVAIEDPVAIRPDELVPLGLRPGERVLFRTTNSARCWRNDAFVQDFVFITAPAAQYLADRRVKLVGVDYLSVGGYKQAGAATHQALLGAGIWIVEGLNLDRLEPGAYDLICLPLKILDGDGAPARALLRPVT
jgi:arylformamidase